MPLVTLYLTERCNSRCVTCDYWRHGRDDMDLGAVVRLLPDLASLGTQVVVLSGGEPLLNRCWTQIAQVLRANGLKVWLLTSGLSLAKHARRVAALCDSVTVSLDGTNRGTYAAIRGVDAFDKVCEGVRAVTACGRAPSLRVTLQRANYRELAAFIELAKSLGARQVSFLAVDIANPHAFARTADSSLNFALQVEDLADFDMHVRRLEHQHAADFQSGFIAESPQKLRRILQYFAAALGEGPYPEVHCNAPQFSAVITAKGSVQPCFFIPGSSEGSISEGLLNVLDSDDMSALRANISTGQRPECTKCVCSMWRKA